ncbi:hypothetical protein MKX03_023461 [Papaver bracteatum]|nr:hypothetical protein MKX03_023461 [Papaver bracteatum]
MENMPLLEPNSKPPITPKGPYDARATFICSIRISAKQLHKLLRGKKNFLMSVIVPTNEPISFVVGHKTFMYCLWAMVPGKEIHRIVLSYIPEDDASLEAVPRTKKRK